jgi:hypothetical protein
MYDNIPQGGTSPFENDLDDTFLTNVLSESPRSYDDNPFEEVEPTEKRFLGLTAWQRLFLSILLFVNVFVIGILCLLFSGRMVPPLP